MSEIKQKPLLVVITGLSGAGRSVAIKCLEDLDFFCIENLPTALLKNMADYFLNSSRGQRFALGMDVRNKEFADNFPALKEWLAERFNVDVVFLTADDETLVNRYNSTRRRHPLLDSGGELNTSISRERRLLSPVRKSADCVFDTSTWSPHFLGRQIESRYAEDEVRRKLYVTITSFGFKYGQYRPADTIFDVRCLKNPHFVPELREKTGTNPAVVDYIFSEPAAQEYLQRLVELHQFLLPLYYAEGKNYFRIGIGCTGGKHRSVAISEELGRKLADLQMPSILFAVKHRDLVEFNPLVQK